MNEAAKHLKQKQHPGKSPADQNSFHLILSNFLIQLVMKKEQSVTTSGKKTWIDENSPLKHMAGTIHRNFKVGYELLTFANNYINFPKFVSYRRLNLW